jgi:hypothetical protein
MAKAPAKPQARPLAKAVTKAVAKPLAKTGTLAAKAQAKPPAKAAPAKPAAVPAGDTMALALKRVAAQNALLTQSLKDAEARIAELERQRDSALDRIEWVIDSLHSLREEQD